MTEVSDKELFQSATAPPEPVPETPVAETPPPEAPAPTPPESPKEEGIPSWRLREEAEARRLAEQRAQALEHRLNEITTHLKQASGAEKKPDLFEDPEAFMQSHLRQVIEPLIQENQKTFIALGKSLAEGLHGEDKVAEAEQAFLHAMEDQSLDPADYERVVTSPNRYDQVVRWHRRQSTLSKVGEDPDAWFKAQLEEKLKDPTFQAEVFKQMGAVDRPSTVQLPPSLSKVPAAARSREVAGDMSDASLFDFAFRQK